MRVPTVLETQVRKLYPRLAVTVQPPCTRLILEDSTGEAIVDLLVGVEDINRLIECLRENEFLDVWAEQTGWMPDWMNEDDD